MIDVKNDDLHEILLRKAYQAAERHGVSIQRIAYVATKNINFFRRIEEGGSCRVDTWQAVYNLLDDDKRLAMRLEYERDNQTKYAREYRNRKRSKATVA